MSDQTTSHAIEATLAATVAGDYHVTASVRTAAGRVKPVRVVLRVNPAD